jgi:hypothetical protein
MPLNDNVVFNNLERTVSDDANIIQSLSGRLLAETVRGMARRFKVGGVSSEPSTFGVASGLKISTSGTNAVVGEGILAIYGVASSPPLVPVPDALDSNTRIGLLTSSVSLPVPSRGVDTYWLIQARVERSDTLIESRDIFNPVTQTYTSTPSIVKRQESKAVASLKEGTTTTIPAPDTGYVRIGAVMLTAGGGSIATNATHQLVPQFGDISTEYSDTGTCNRTSFKHRSNQQINEASTGSYFHFAAEVNGYKLWAKTDNTTTDTTLRDTAFIDPNYTGSASTSEMWWYVYLAAPDDYVPENFYSNGTTMDVEHRGLIISSRVRPDVHGLNNSSLGVPNPLGGTILAGNAACVGIFRTNGTGTNIDFVDVSTGGLGRVEKQQFRQGSGSGFVMNNGNNFLANTYDLATLGVSSTEDVPFGVQLHCWIANQLTTGIDTTPPPYAIIATFTMTNDTSGNHENIYCPLEGFTNRRFDLHPEEDSLSMTLYITKIDSAGSTSTDTAVSVFNAGLLGYSF